MVTLLSLPDSNHDLKFKKIERMKKKPHLQQQHYYDLYYQYCEYDNNKNKKQKKNKHKISFKKLHTKTFIILKRLERNTLTHTHTHTHTDSKKILFRVQVQG